MHLISVTSIAAVFSVFFISTHGEKFSALSEMENLARDEEKIVREFEKFLFTMGDVMKYFEL